MLFHASHPEKDFCEWQRESDGALQRHKHKHTPYISHELLASRAVGKSAGEAVAAVYVAGRALVDTPGLADDIIL